MPFDLVPGVAQGLDLKTGTSGLVVHGDVLTIPVPLMGTQTLTIGNDRNGQIPLVVKAASVQFPKVSVGTLACACVRGVAFKTCGGSLFESDGTTSPSCTSGFFGSVDCPADKPCAFVHGEGNSASGTITCTEYGFADLCVEANCSGPERYCSRPCIGCPFTQSGSAQVLSTLALGTVVGACAAGFCSDADPMDARGAPSTLPFVTGTAGAVVCNANFQDGVLLGPYALLGAPFICVALDQGNTGGACLVNAVPLLSQPTVGDIVLTTVLCSEPGTTSAPSPTPTPTPVPRPCVGDCGGDGAVTIDEIIRMIAIALETVPITACPNYGCCADSGDGCVDVYIDCLLEAINNALGGCPAHASSAPS